MLPVINHVIGDDQDYDFQILDAAGNPENVTGWSFHFTVKSAPADADADAVFQLTSTAAQIVVDVAATGLGRLLVRAAHTKQQAPGRYFADLQATTSGGQIKTLYRGVFNLIPEITATPGA